MAGFVSWVDYSSTERRRMREAVALFKERETRDELGVGNIRDAIADALFPGTSTIQTRLRYLLFVPWVYRELEVRGGVRSHKIETRARRAELELIEPLQEAERGSGILGSRAGAALQRLPSSVYWNALWRWGIFTQDWSIDEYHRSWDQMRAERQGQRVTDDSGILPDAVRTWHPDLPEPWDGFPAKATFDLRREEAVFLQERIRAACRGSLLAHAIELDQNHRPALDATVPWHAFGDLPPALAHQLRTAERFAELMQGAALVYNIALAQTGEPRSEIAERHLESFGEWSHRAAEAHVTDWDLDELWTFCDAQKANVGRLTRTFVQRWQNLLRAHGPRDVAHTAEARSLIEHREAQLKGTRSRFRNPRARELWSGNSGTSLMNYRWPTARRFLADLYQGLDGRQDVDAEP